MIQNVTRLTVPICSTMSGGKTREANALLKMSENSLSRPPMPMRSKFQSGLIIVWRASLVLAFPDVQRKKKSELFQCVRFKQTFKTGFMRQNLPTSVREEFSAFSKITWLFPTNRPISICTDAKIRNKSVKWLHWLWTNRLLVRFNKPNNGAGFIKSFNLRGEFQIKWRETYVF